MRVIVFVHKCFEGVVPFWTVVAHLTCCLRGAVLERCVIDTVGDVSLPRPEKLISLENTVVTCVSVLFQALQGKQCRHPFTNRLLPIIADALVDTQLGTGDKHSRLLKM